MKQQPLMRCDSIKKKEHFKINTYHHFHTFDKLVEAEKKVKLKTRAAAKRICLVNASKRIPDVLR